MQLAPTDELTLVSGQPPIRAKKLRYFEDEAFTARVLPAPALGDTAYPALPPSRPDTWAGQIRGVDVRLRSEEHTSELQSLMRISYAVFCLKKKTTIILS